jgi:predicted AlkP superfamily phosphohydrolase/phosphomutase
MTGRNPAKTGIYDFLYRKEDSYSLPPVSRLHRDGAAIWDLLSQAGKRVGVLNVPMTYPPKPVNGFMITGWMTPNRASDYAYPASVLDELRTAVGNYHIYPTETFSEQRKKAFLDASNQLLDMRTRAALHLMRNHPWDFFMLVFFDTDRILHQMWHYLDPEHPWRENSRAQDWSKPVWRYFQRLDRRIGELVAEAGEDTLVIIMSDHGMGATHRMIVLNNWLVKNDWLHFRDGPITRFKHRLFKLGFTLKNMHELVDRLRLSKHAEYKALYSVDVLLKKLFLSFDDVDWSRSQAYSYGRMVGPIYINLKGREPQGIVEPGHEYETLRAEIAAKAEGFYDLQGNKLVGKVLYREQVYQGLYLDQAPDLILLPNDPRDVFYGLADFGSNRLMQPMYRYSGMHRDDGLLIMAGPGARKGLRLENAHLIDLAPTILQRLGVPAPEEMDGRPLVEAFSETNFPTVSPPPPNGHHRRNGNGFTDDEARQLEVLLRQMGYL